MLKIQRKERFVWAGADRNTLVKLLGGMVSLQREGRIWTFGQEESAVEKMPWGQTWRKGREVE